MVGKISVMRQSNAALPHDITPLNTAETTKFWTLLNTQYMDAEHNPADTVLNTKKKEHILLNETKIYSCKIFKWSL